MNAIAAVTTRWGIGRDNGLPFHLKDDMRRFRALTGGGTVIMGRKTLDSLPGGKPLPKRRNIVITRDMDFAREGVEVVHSVEEALQAAAQDDPDKVWVCGGGQIYREMLPYCHICYITRVYADIPCDVSFPNLDAMGEWRLLREDPILTEGDTDYQFVEYVKEQ